MLQRIEDPNDSNLSNTRVSRVHATEIRVCKMRRARVDRLWDQSRPFAHAAR